MTSLKEQLQADLTTAMKSRDELTTATLRMALTAVTNEEVSGKQSRTLTDDEVMAVLRREIKKRKEAGQAFADAGREESAAREADEAGVLEAYLPSQLTDDELTTLVAEAVASVDTSGPHAMGVVMKTVTPMVAGRADGGRVAAAVRAALAS
ncbi:MAG: GatB/YqeY domain-containing protein [Actinomycetes bacterium]